MEFTCRTPKTSTFTTQTWLAVMLIKFAQVFRTKYTTRHKKRTIEVCTEKQRENPKLDMKYLPCNAGDDCISIQTGCSGINIHNVNCGPGHGISIGGLGKYNTKACVSNITVRDVNMFRTMTGVRIKTWQVIPLR
jgi:hypothetical protein